MGFTMSYLERAITDGHAKLSGEGKQQKILYVAVNHTERYADPEEQVRAEFWAELIYRYGYEPARIGVEITVPDRTPSDRADLVVFRDDERKKPYAVIECKADGVTDAEFNPNSVVEDRCNVVFSGARASGVWFSASRQKPRPTNISPPEIPEIMCVKSSGATPELARGTRALPKPEEYRFYKGDPNNDLQPVSKEALIGAIKQCHQTLWAGGKLSPPTAFGELCKINQHQSLLYAT
jgi:type I restriction enzyme M protein